MNRRRVIRSLGVAAAAAPLSQAQQWNDGFAKQWRDMFLSHWEVEKKYTLAVADAMPAESYDAKPVEAQRTFGEQLVHLGRANTAYMAAFGIKGPPPASERTDKASVLAYVSATFDYVTEILTKLGEKELTRKDLKFNARTKPHNGSDLFMRAYVHTAHHRGQAVVYLRVKGIVPPTWAFEPSA